MMPSNQPESDGSKSPKPGQLSTSKTRDRQGDGSAEKPIATKLRRRRKPKPRSGSKKAKVLAMLRRPGGASMSNFRKRPDGKRIRYADLSAHT
jgi:hypothetical protein